MSELTGLKEQINKINESTEVKTQLLNLFEQVEKLKKIIAKYEEPEIELIPVTKIVTKDHKVISEELK